VLHEANEVMQLTWDGVSANFFGEISMSLSGETALYMYDDLMTSYYRIPTAIPHPVASSANEAANPLLVPF
jgi:hypothetical protein